MIQKIVFKDVNINEFERSFSTNSDFSGRILSCSVKLSPGVDVSIVTSLNEEVLSVREDGIYYPRQNISSRKDGPNELTGEVQESDYFYFIDGLLIELNSEGEMNGEVALKELTILYDDMQ